eukprot:758796-Hanusia_phi.AAC.1
MTVGVPKFRLGSDQAHWRPATSALPPVGPCPEGRRRSAAARHRRRGGQTVGLDSAKGFRVKRP